MAMTCARPPEAKEAADAAVAVFVGKIVGWGNSIHPVSCTVGWLRDKLGFDYRPSPCLTGYIEFEVTDVYKGSLAATIILPTEAFSGSFGEFKGKSLLVYAEPDEHGQPFLNICGRNIFSERMEDDVRFLRQRYPHAH
jgi:hypothetical protein